LSSSSSSSSSSSTVFNGLTKMKDELGDARVTAGTREIQ
jgi:hypothetical protein